MVTPRDLPDDLAPGMLFALLHAGIASIGTDRKLGSRAPHRY